MDERHVLDRRNVSFIMVTKAVIKDVRLKASDKAVYSVLCMYADNHTSDCFPSRETIIAESCVSDKTLRNSISRLQKFGYIDVEKRSSKYGRASNRYVLLNIENKR